MLIIISIFPFIMFMEMFKIALNVIKIHVVGNKQALYFRLITFF